MGIVSTLKPSMVKSFKLKGEVHRINVSRKKKSPAFESPDDGDFNPAVLLQIRATTSIST